MSLSSPPQRVLGASVVVAMLVGPLGCVQSASLGGELPDAPVGFGGEGEGGEWDDTECGSDTEGHTSDDGESGDDGTLPSSWDPPPDCTGDAEDGRHCLPAAVTDCATEVGYVVSSWRDPVPEVERLWVAGVYETRPDAGVGDGPSGEATVRWALDGPNVLVVSAYEPTHWTVALSGAGELTRIIATGVYRQSVDAPPGVAVEIHSAEAGTADFACGYAVPGEGGGCEGEALAAFAQRAAGRSISGFDGCYSASDFYFGW
ncbi:MAG: hypothetical protein AAF721_30775 [Myxococcota bacterium]